MRKSFKYRVYCNTEQAASLDWQLRRCCELYNACLQERKEIWTVCKRHPNFYDPEWRTEHAHEYTCTYYTQANALPELKQDIRPEYQQVGSHVLQDVLHRVDKAFQAFFRRVSTGQKAGYPRYKSSTQYDSLTFPDVSGWKLTNNRLSVTNVGILKVKLHREIQGTIKTCTLKKEGQHWFVIFACELDATPKLPYTDEAIGIDLGLLHFATLSTGDTIDNPRCYRKSEKKLAKAQQALTRKKRSSNRRKKAVQRVAKCHRKVRNQRKDFLQKQSTQLVQTYETIVFEKLSPQNLSKRPKAKQDETTGAFLPNGAATKGGLNKSIHDAGWSTFIALCESKAENAGTVQVLKVNPKNTSQICSGCLKKGPKKELSERTHTCTHCGLVLDRDVNASLNILRLGRSHQEISVA